MLAEGIDLISEAAVLGLLFMYASLVAGAALIVLGYQ
jgi:hypothetical protein